MSASGPARVAAASLWVCIAVIGLAACTSRPSPRAPSPVRVTDGSLDGLPTCGRVPVSNGPNAKTIAATLRAPTSARAGTKIKATIVLTAKDKPVGFDSGLPAELLIANGRRVVGRYEGFIAGTGVGTNLEPGRTVTYPVDGLLSGCPHDLKVAKPDATRRPLPPGIYQLVAVMEDNVTYGSGTHPTSIVTAAATIHITT